MIAVPEEAVTAARKACPSANADMLRRALQAAAPHIAAAERERIRHLAIDKGAIVAYPCGTPGCTHSNHALSFADLLDTP